MKNRCFLASVVVIFLLGSLALHGQSPWPVEQTNADHPIGNVFGEFQQYTGAPYLHPGHDIREDCAPNGPWVCSTVGGALTLSDNANIPTYIYNGVTIVDANNRTFRYWHLDHNSITQDVRNAVANGTAFPANTRIAQLVYWPSASFNHLHYDIQVGTNFMNPFSLTGFGLTPENDTFIPRVTELLICGNNSSVFTPKPASGLWTVSGNLDIIAHAYDEDTPPPSVAYQANLGVYRIEYSIQELTGTRSHNVATRQLIRFDSFPTAGQGGAWAAIIYKNVAPADSNSNYSASGAEQYYYIVTNLDASGALSEQNGSWNTAGGGFPDGLYQINVAAYDFVGNRHVKSEIVFVNNNPTTLPPVNILIRDHGADDGTVPSNANGEAFWVSPDIRVDAPPLGINNATGQPFGPTDHENPVYGQVNNVYVRAWNIGANVGNSADIRLYWADPSGGIPASDWNEIDPGNAHTLNNVAPDGLSQVMIPWTPTGTAIGHRCLLARAVSPQDPITNDYSVAGDNNISMKNVSIVQVDTGVETKPMQFYVQNPLKKIAQVHLEIDLSGYPALGDIYLELQANQQIMDYLKQARIPMILKDGKIVIHMPRSNRFVLKGITMKPGERFLVDIGFKLSKLPKLLSEKVSFWKPIRVDVIQYADKIMTGGLTYYVQRK